MTPTPPNPRSRRPLAATGGAALLLVVGWLAGGATSSSAAALDDCVLPDACPTVPSLPPIPTLPTTPTLPTSPSDPPPSGTASSGGGAGAPAEPAAPTGTAGTAPKASFSFRLERVAARRRNGSRRIELRLSLSEPATVVTVLRRRKARVLAAVRAGRAGTNRFVITVPRRVRAGTYALQLRLTTKATAKTVARKIAIPR